MTFAGYSRGIAAPWAATWITDLSPDNNVAELVAMFNAQYWRLAMLRQLDHALPTCFYADNALAYQGP